MARPGPPPKPTALRLLNGNPSGRPFNGREANPSRATTLDPPDRMSVEAAAEWRRIARELDDIGLLTRCDMTAFEVYCEHVAMFHRLQEKIAQFGENQIVGATVKPYPWTKQIIECAATIRMYSAEFGLTPSSRCRIEVPQRPRTVAEEDDDLAL